MDTLELITWSKVFAPSWDKDFPDNYYEWRLIYFFNGKNIIFISVRQLLCLLVVLSNNLPPLYNLTFNVSGYLHFQTNQLPLQDVLSAGLPANQ